MLSSAPGADSEPVTLTVWVPRFASAGTMTLNSALPSLVGDPGPGRRGACPLSRVTWPLAPIVTFGDRVVCGPVGKVDCDFLGHGGFFGINHCLRADGERGGDVLARYPQHPWAVIDVLLVGLELGRGGIDLKGSGVIRDRNLAVFRRSIGAYVGIVAVQSFRNTVADPLAKPLKVAVVIVPRVPAGRAQLDHAVDCVPSGFSASSSISTTSTVYIPPAVGLVMPALCLITTL